MGQKRTVRRYFIEVEEKPGQNTKNENILACTRDFSWGGLIGGGCIFVNDEKWDSVIFWIPFVDVKRLAWTEIIVRAYVRFS